MIECTNKNIWYKKRRFKIKRLFVFIIFLILIVSIFTYYKYIVTEKVLSFCCEYAKICAIECANDSVVLSLNDKVKYEELITIERNNSGDVSLIQTNPIKINQINREISLSSTALLKNKLSKGVPIPLLYYLGITIFSGYGPTTNFSAIYLSSTKCEFVSQFKSVGINQTLHSIYVSVISEINLQMPTEKRTEKIVSNVLLVETVIVGKVPDFYLNGDIFS